MTIETLLQNLTDAINANTATLKGSAPAAKAPAPAVTPAPAAKPAPAPAAKPAPAPKAPAAPAVSDDKLAIARTELKKVLDAKGANEVRALLSRVGAVKLSEVTPETVDILLEHIATALGGGEPALFE